LGPIAKEYNKKNQHPATTAKRTARMLTKKRTTERGATREPEEETKIDWLKLGWVVKKIWGVRKKPGRAPRRKKNTANE